MRSKVQDVSSRWDNKRLIYQTLFTLIYPLETYRHHTETDTLLTMFPGHVVMLQMELPTVWPLLLRSMHGIPMSIDKLASTVGLEQRKRATTSHSLPCTVS